MSDGLIHDLGYPPPGADGAILLLLLAVVGFWLAVGWLIICMG